MSESFDVVVVGGGRGGAAPAAVLARAGVDVLLLEREPAFRDRVRGEWLAPWGRVELDALGLQAIAESVPHANVISRHIPYDEIFSPELAEQNVFELGEMVPTGGCLALHHPPFQEAMLVEAAAAGATVRRGVDAVRVTAGASPSVSFEHD